MDVILASSSPYRQRLLARLQIPFSCIAPEVDETRLPDEAPAAMALYGPGEKAPPLAGLGERRRQKGALSLVKPATLRAGGAGTPRAEHRITGAGHERTARWKLPLARAARAEVGQEAVQA